MLEFTIKVQIREEEENIIGIKETIAASLEEAYGNCNVAVVDVKNK